MAAIQSDAGDYFGSQESLLISLKYLDRQKEGDHYCLSADYNELGTSSMNLKNYDAAIGYYDLALKFIGNDDFKTVVLNNKAVAYQKMGRYNQAIDLYQSIIDKSKASRKEYARILSNLARVKWLQDPSFRAAPDMLTALRIREDEKDAFGQNASYAHLSDYYSHTKPDSALIYADKMFAVAKKLNSPDDELEALTKLLTFSPTRTLKQYFIRYQYLSDSIQTSRNAAKNQFALIRYDAEKNKADNLRLQKDNAEKKIQIIQQRGIIGLFVIGVIIAIFWYRKRRQRIMIEHRATIRESQLKTSQKVHDVVANGLYRIMTEVGYQDTIAKEPLLDKIEALYEKSRDISYEKPYAPVRDFQEAIAELVKSFATPETKVLLAGNKKELWNKVKDPEKKELDYFLQELMVNMRKHSFAKNVVVKFETRDDQLKVQYTDDGVGLSPAFQPGNGLTNTGNRIKSIGGQIIFDTQGARGLKIEVYLPLA